MRTNTLPALLACAFTTMFCSQSGASVVTTGLLKASANCNAYIAGTNHPADKPYVSPSTTLVAQAFSISSGNGTITHTLAENSGKILIDASTSAGAGANATGSGSASLTASTTESLIATLNGTVTFGGSLPNVGGHHTMTVKISDTGGDLADLLFDWAPGDPSTKMQSAPVTLTPGNYSLLWTLSDFPTAGGGGSATIHFDLSPAPEPNSLLLVGSALAMTAARRRTRRPSSPLA